ncbi:MAG: N-acetyltransferase [Corynebacterium sp.]|nr:N-acetyltransferase [Corynebacterium sp.]
MFEIRTTNNEDVTYIKRLNYLTEVFGNEQADLPADFREGLPFYIGNWQPTDGVLASDDNGIPAGAIWYLWGDADNHGTGFVAEEYPELAIAIDNRFRGQGLASALFTALFAQLQERGIPGVSLCVHTNNGGAQKIYEAKGFEFVRTDGEWNVFLLKF